MNIVKNFVKNKSVGYWLMAGAFVCGLVAMILFFATEIVGFSRIYEAATATGFIVFVVLSAASLVYELRIVKYLTAAVGLYMFAMYIVCEMNFLSNVLYGIDGNSLTGSYIAILVLSLIAFGLATASAVMMGSGFAREKKEKKTKKTACDDASEEAEA